jgi:hypothetical protein
MLLLAGLASLPTLLIWLVIIGIVLAVAWYAINALFPEPFRKWAIVILVVVGAIILITYVLMPLAGGGTP